MKEPLEAHINQVLSQAADIALELGRDVHQRRDLQIHIQNALRQISAQTWYERDIEPGIRPLVRLLRDNGFNTVMSCEHAMAVTCHYYPENPHDINRLTKLLLSNGYEQYQIEVRLSPNPQSNISNCLIVRLPCLPAEQLGERYLGEGLRSAYTSPSKEAADAQKER